MDLNHETNAGASSSQYLGENSEREDGGHAASYCEILENIPAGIIITDEVGNPVEYNENARRLLGDIPASLTLMDWPARFGLYIDEGKTHFPAWDTPLSHALNGSRMDNVAEIYVGGYASGGRWMVMSATTLWSDTGRIRGAIVSISDLTPGTRRSSRKSDQILQRKALYDFTEQIAKSGDDPNKVLNTAVVLTSELIGDGCVATLLSISGDRLRLISFHHKRERAKRLLHASAFSQEYALGDKIEHVIRSGKPLLVPDVDEVLLLKESPPEYARYIQDIGVHSLLVVPIKGHDGVLGTLTLFRDRGGLTYDQSDQYLVMDIAYRLGLAIENNTLLNSLRAENTGRLSAEKALEFSEIRFRSIFTSTSLGIKILDLEGNLLVTNPAFQRMLSYHDYELFGKSVTDFFFQADVPAFLSMLNKLKNLKAQSVQMEHRFVAKDGSIVWVNATFSRIMQQDRNSTIGYIVGIDENVTIRKNMEAEVAEMKSRLNNHIETERLHLAQDLHDGPLQDLYSALYRIENWDEKVNRDKVETLKQDLLKVVQGLRDTARDLRPQALTSFGLEKAIRSHVEEFIENHSELKIHLNLAQDKQELPEETRIILFRIYQNSLANVLRHAHASEVFISFSFDAEAARLEIRDNGVGFVLPNNWVELVRQGHYGLAGAVERMALMGGTFNVDSKPGQGTLVEASIPTKENSIGHAKEDLEL